MVSYAGQVEVLAPLLLSADIANVLRYVRDATLLRAPPGKRAVALYYQHSAEMTALLATRPGLARRAASIVSQFVDDLRERGGASMPTRDSAIAFAHALLPLASPGLRRDIEDTLQNDPWSLYLPCSTWRAAKQSS
jgi:hypothetical protein